MVTQTPPVADPRIEELTARARSGAHWFYWIAGLSLINAVIALAGSDMMFVMGTAATQLLSALPQMEGIGPVGLIIAIPLILLILGIYITLGIFAAKRHAWAFIVGIVLYGLDALITLPFQLWFSAAFHALALFYIFGGLSAAREANALARSLENAPPSVPPIVPPPPMYQPTPENTPTLLSPPPVVAPAAPPQATSEPSEGQ